MRTSLSSYGVLVALAALPAACSNAAAGNLDRSDPARCYAALYYARTMAMRGEPNVRSAVSFSARAFYEAAKLKRTGDSDQGFEDAKSIIRKVGADDAAWLPIIKDCLKQQDADPKFRALDGSGALIRVARKIEPACQLDVSCRDHP